MCAALSNRSAEGACHKSRSAPNSPMASAALVQAGERLRVLASSDSSAQDASAIHAVLVELERYPMSKKTLHETRIGAIVNSARKRIAAPQLQRIAKRVIASWRSVVQDTTTPAASNSPVPAVSHVSHRVSKSTLNHCCS